VALKVVAPHLSDDPNFEERFRREAAMLLRLKHPNIVEVEDAGESDGYAFLVMPFLELGTLMASGSLPTSTSSPILTSSPESTDPIVFGEASTLTPIPTALATDPSPTQIPSPLPSPIPSLTPLPSNTPVSTPTADVCSSLAHGAIGISDREVSWEIPNDGSAAVAVTHIVFDWPEVNEGLKKVRLSESTIWNKRDDLPATDIQSDWLGNRVLLGGESKHLKFEFVVPAAASGYDLFVEFDAGCQLLADG
jgi:hypothetical protein